MLLYTYQTDSNFCAYNRNRSFECHSILCSSVWIL